MSENAIPEKLEQVDYPVPVNTCAATGEKLEYDGRGIPREAYAENRDAARAGRIYSAKAVEAARKGKGKEKEKDEPKKDNKPKDEKKAGKPKPPRKASKPKPGKKAVKPEPKGEDDKAAGIGDKLKGALGVGGAKQVSSKKDEGGGEAPKPDASEGKQEA